MILQTKQKGLGFQFRKTSALVSKVGIMLTWSKMTICHFGLFLFSFFLFLFCSVSAILCLSMFENLPNKINIVFDNIYLGDLCHIDASNFYFSFIFGFAFYLIQSFWFWFRNIVNHFKQTFMHNSKHSLISTKEILLHNARILVAQNFG